MTAHDQAGFTLIELMTAIALSAVIGTAMFALGGEARHGARTAATLGDQLDGYRRALDVLTDDLRCAKTISTDTDGALRIAGPGRNVSWRQVAGDLVRTRDDRQTLVAHAVEALEVASEGPTFRIALRISPRTTLRTVVARRVEEVR